MDFVKIISDIFSKNTSEDIREYLSKLKMTVPKEEFIKVCENKIIDINIKIKNYIIQNGEEIIKIFDLIRKIKEEFYLLKKSFDTMKNQMIILKKKYIEPFEKLIKALINKANIEKMMILFEKAKRFKEDIKIIKSHYDKDTLLLSLQNFDVFLRLIKNDNFELKGIIFIKEEYDWFSTNKENILNKYRQLFIKNVMNKSNEDLFKISTDTSTLGQIKNNETVIYNTVGKCLNQFNNSDYYEWIFERNISKLTNALSKAFANSYNSVNCSREGANRVIIAVTSNYSYSASNACTETHSQILAGL